MPAVKRIWSPLEEIELLRRRRNRLAERIVQIVKQEGNNGFSVVYLYLRKGKWILEIPEIGCRIKGSNEEQLLAEFQRFILSRTVIELRET